MMFDEKKALKLLEEDRRKYLKRTIEFTQGFLERCMDDAAVTTIIAAAENLQRLNGSMQYLEELQNYTSEEDYPRFSPVLGD